MHSEEPRTLLAGVPENDLIGLSIDQRFGLRARGPLGATPYVTGGATSLESSSPPGVLVATLRTPVASLSHAINADPRRNSLPAVVRRIASQCAEHVERAAQPGGSLEVVAARGSSHFAEQPLPESEISASQ